MRIERTGKIDPLTPRVERFLVEALGGVLLDDVVAPEDSKADYSCLRGLLAIELKTLDEDGSERMDNLTDELRKRPDWPVFLGSAPMESFLKHLDDPEPVRMKLLNRVGRAIVNHLKKANKQLGAHAETFPRKNLVRAVLMVNEDHEIYEPSVVTYIVQHTLGRMENGARLYPNIDAVIFMSERHATIINGLVAFPVLMIEGPEIGLAPWKEAVLERVMDAWGEWSRIPLYASKKPVSFATIDHIPETAPRHERWRTDYRRNPYMRHFTKEQLRDAFDEVIALTTCAMVKDGPIKGGRDFTLATMPRFTHIMMEMSERAIPVTDFPKETARLIAAARRLGLPPQAVEWLERLLKEEGDGS